MKNVIYFLSFLFLVSCGSKEAAVGDDDQRTIQKLVVAVDTKGGSTILSSGRLDNWYRINTPLTEGWIYEVSMEIPRVVKDPLIIPARLLDFTPVELFQRDLFGRYINKYQEIRTALPSEEDSE